MTRRSRAFTAATSVLAARAPRRMATASRTRSRAVIVATAALALTLVQCEQLIHLDDFYDCPQDPRCPSCSNGKKDGTETDVDCGGECPGKCAADLACNAGSDCQSGVCTGGKCEAPAGPSCSDGVKNGAETGKDCGGGTCPGCPEGEGCFVGTDCESLACSANHACVPAQCNDLLKNGDETDIDCGGSCSPCAYGKHCAQDKDCANNGCSNGICEGQCSPGSKQCVGLDAQTCDANGTWQTAETCAYVCDAGSCTGACTPGAKQCSGNTPQTCDATGQWQDGTACMYVCSVGDCIGQCTPGTQQCSGLDAQTCDASGTWQTSQTCPYVCTAGACTGVCTPSSTQCTGNTPQACDAGGQWQNSPTCSGSTPFCAAGMCSANPPSCQAGAVGAGNNCGPAANESCCTSLPVTGGTFHRSYDGATFTDMSSPATVSSFRLDKFEITVGRFRQFVNAWVSGWRPAAGAGKHSHLNGGSGLANSGSAGSYEMGWDPAWDANLGTTAGDWNTNLVCGAPSCTWTPTAGAAEKLPVNYATWYETYAFCIWDGGFLPSEAEWNYAAAGGSEQRVYPWSSPPTSTAIDCSYLYYGPCVGTQAPPNAVGSKSPKGNSKYGQSDLGGNTFEMTLDFYANYVSPCVDCADLVSSTYRVMRGGGYTSDANGVKVSARWTVSTPRNAYQGARCARSP